GGTETQLITLLGALGGRFDQRVICFRKTGTLLEAARRLGHEPRELPLRGSLKGPQALLAITRLASWLRDERAELVHCHDVYGILVGVPAARLCGLPVIAARRDLGHHVGALMRPALRAALRRATRVLCNAATVASLVEDEDGVPIDRLAVIPNGIDVATFD